MTFTVMYYHVSQEIESYIITMLEQYLEKRNLENYTELLSFFFRNRVFPKLIDLNRYGVEQRLRFEKWDRAWLEDQVLRTEDEDVKKEILDFTDEFYNVCLSIL
jgi:hypothetical protein